MSVAEFRSVKPGVIPDEVMLDQKLTTAELTAADSWQGLPGRWDLRFEAGVLETARFTHHSNGVRLTGRSEAELARLKAHYASYLTTTATLRSTLEADLGEPSQLEDETRIEENRAHTLYDKMMHLTEQWSRDRLDVQLNAWFYGRSNGSDAEEPSLVETTFSYDIDIELRGVGEPGDISHEEFYPGMRLDELEKSRPDLFPDENAIKGEWHEKEFFGDLDVDWYYRFRGGQLYSYGWSRYNTANEEINGTNFNRWLSTARRLIDRLEEMYGEPTSLEKVNTTSVFPWACFHSEPSAFGCDVIEAGWVMPGERVEVKFAFLGGKSEYRFLLTFVHSYDDVD